MWILFITTIALSQAQQISSGFKSECSQLAQEFKKQCVSKNKTSLCEIRDEKEAQVFYDLILKAQAITDKTDKQALSLLNDHMNVDEMTEFMSLSNNPCATIIPRKMWLSVMEANIKKNPTSMKENFLSYIQNSHATFIKNLLKLSLVDAALKNKFVPVKDETAALEELKTLRKESSQKSRELHHTFTGSIKNASMFRKIQVYMNILYFKYIKQSKEVEFLWDKEFNEFLLSEARASEEVTQKTTEFLQKHGIVPSK